MVIMRAEIVILRRRESYNYKRDPKAPDSWQNNDANNSLDELILFLNGKEAIRSYAQTVSNHPEGRFVDTIAPGTFALRLWVDKRLFSGPVHGITGARDIEGDWTDYASVQINDLSRWLAHDTRKLKKRASDPDLAEDNITRVAWSAGCIVMPPEGAKSLSTTLIAAGYKAGDVIPGVIIIV
jgi:hypothetical protein